jgi:DNA-binding MarR family transcriptional regulator
MSNNSGLSKADYESLLRFRTAIRRFLRFSEETARKAGLTPQQHQVLLAILGQPGKEWASISEIAEALQLKHNTTVGLVDRCQVAGLVVRAQDVEDRRLVRVMLTERGVRMLDGLTSRNVAELRSLSEALRLPGIG